MIDETKDRITQLVEINRALAHDLDVRQRAMTEMRREREALKKQVQSLQDEVRSHAALDISGELRREIDNIRSELGQSRHDLDHIRRERDHMLREVQAAKAQAALAEEHRRAFENKVRGLQRERDHLEEELEASFVAMDEIRRRLVMSVGEFSPPDSSDRYAGQWLGAAG